MASEPRQIQLVLPDLSLTLTTDRGVFSGEAIDPGTKLLLLEGPVVPERGHLLDLGCGYGPIALTLARRSPAATVWAIDVNRRALALTRTNAEAAGAGNVVAVHPDQVPDDIGFAAIWSNPPVRVGKGPLQALLQHWLSRLTDPGQACLVVHKNLGGDSLATWLTAHGHTTRRLSSRMGYRLLVASARSAAK